jgi:hypothetical protein
VQYAESFRNAVTGSGSTFSEIEHAEKVLTQSYNRYTRALVALAKAQKLALPKAGKLIEVSTQRKESA